ncbi:non-canonical purine NTP pyrophosphatase [Aeoliella sp. ICT_H6.2]|uniref:dITP/XTP pyrophosphatase n=1 Tax=Aeoliella straminimaris TaxID=2954799 RepID=A0A9X2JEN1_9BACT|nr:non-canonical purine NTP pyrophosphatase [Aeoliella straminimaris]MCO6042372.1 non-canonical purine NTP pyrophosphatase [Aeoliella straminimaris]
MSKRVVIGTHNKKKGVELAEMLGPYGLEVATLDDFPTALDVVEDGDTFAANARLKATQQAVHLGEWVLADDSGIEIDALKGAPGIYSARFAGEQATDEDNNRLLLEKLGDLPPEKRGARYYCHVTLANPTGKVRAESHATCRGIIRREPVGANGFGYDPLFEVREYHRTFGELGPAVKRALSHRSRAMRAIVPKLVALISA